LTAELSEGPGATEAVGARIAAALAPGDVVLVSGELGAGKTTLIRGACRALGVTEPVSSPTFTIGKRYPGRVPVSHLDLYRLEDLTAEDPGLLDDYLTPDAISFVEWPQRAVEGLLGDDAVRVALRVALSHAGGDRREISLTPAA
jgi:tRNA threonylcarbamoyladenosine biosynthesis protein TsaE